MDVSIHNTTEIKIRRRVFPGFEIMEYVFIGEHGAACRVSAFCDTPVEVEHGETEDNSGEPT